MEGVLQFVLTIFGPACIILVITRTIRLRHMYQDFEEAVSAQQKWQESLRKTYSSDFPAQVCNEEMYPVGALTPCVCPDCMGVPKDPVPHEGWETWKLPGCTLVWDPKLEAEVFAMLDEEEAATHMTPEGTT